MDLKNLLNKKAFGTISEGKHSWKITKIEAKESERGAYLSVTGTVDGTERVYVKNMYSEIDIEYFVNALVDQNDKLQGLTLVELLTKALGTTINMWLIPSGDFINIRYKEPKTTETTDNLKDAVVETIEDDE